MILRAAVVCVAFLTMSSFVCFAETDESKHEISASYGYITLPQAIDLLSTSTGGLLEGLLLGIVDIIVPGEHESPKRIDHGGSGSFSFQYLYSLNNRVKLGGTVCYESTWGKWSNGNEYIVHFPAIMATTKISWFNHKHFGMYSKYSLGLILLLGKNKEELIPMLTGQASTVCMEFGGKALRGFLETGWGNQGLINLGVRFGF